MIVRARRQALAALSVLLLALGAPGLARAQTGQAPPTFPQLTPDTGTAPAPAPAPAPTTTGSTAPSATSSTRTPAAPQQAMPSTLPETGMDGRILGGAGLGLLLCGLGLRMRTARERF